MINTENKCDTPASVMTYKSRFGNFQVVHEPEDHSGLRGERTVEPVATV